ncbi:Nardilysin, partial [Pygoscelis antarcticus]
YVDSHYNVLFHSCSVVLLDTFVSILSLTEPAYGADIAKLENKLVAGEHGLVVRVKGLNHKLPHFLYSQLITDHLSDFRFTPAVSEMIKEELKKTYFNMLIKSEVLAK